mgnify:CR=1 FL=1
MGTPTKIHDTMQILAEVELEMVERLHLIADLPDPVGAAMSTDPPVLIADEPTGSLDSVTADHIFEVFEHLVADQGKTIVTFICDTGERYFSLNEYF